MLRRRPAAPRATPLRLEYLESRSLLATLPADLVSWYRAEENAADETGNHPGTLQGGLGFGPGEVNRAFQMDGVDDSVDLGTSFNLQTFTIDLWVKPAPGSDQVTYADIIDNNHTDFRSWVLQYDNVGDQYHWGLDDGGGTTSITLTPNVWQHIALTRDAATHVNDVYLNGALVGSTTGTGDIVYDGTEFFRLGQWGGGGRNLKGSLDEVRIHSRVLTQAEIQAIVDAGSEGQATAIVVTTTADEDNGSPDAALGTGTSLREAILFANSRSGPDTIGFSIPRPSTSDLVSWWQADGNTNDSAGANNGTLQNGATFKSGRYGQAFSLDGTDDFVEFADSPALDGMAQLTVDAWVKFDSLPNGKYQWIVSKGSAFGAGTNSYSIWLAGDTMRLTAAVETGSGLQTVQSAETFTDTTSFHHVALTYDGVALKLFVDGVRQGVGALSGSILDTDFAVLVGRRSGPGTDENGDVLSGLVDDVGVSNRALSDAEIQAIASGARTISPTSPLPTITDPVVIDGYAQPGASRNTDPSGFNGTLLVELNGADAGAAVGLDIAAGSSIVRGLAINRFSQEGIVLRSAGGSVVEGNFLGTDPTGTIPLPDRGGVMLYAGSNANTVGGATPASRNIISGNLWNGVEINGFGGGSSNNLVQGNFIGTNAAGTAPLGNGIHGVYILNAFGNSVGGAAENLSNHIAFNAAAGVKVEGASSNNAVLANSIFTNNGLGIDLDNNGVTPNDLGDGDSGPNHLQNFPVLTSVTSSGATTAIQGTLNSLASAPFRIELFASAASDPSGNGEGQTFLGFVNTTTNSTGDAAFNFTTPALADAVFSATATRLDAGTGASLETSEFSAAVTASAMLATIQFAAASYEVIEGQPFAILTVQRSGALNSSARVDFETVDGTAGQPRIRSGFGRLEDFTTTSGTLVFRPRENVAQIRVPIFDDSLVEADETFRVVLSNPSSGFELGAISTANVVIHDNDPSLSFVVASSQRNENATGRGTIEVQLQPASNKTVTVNFAAVSGTATAGQDFRPAAGTLTFHPGETRKFINFTVVDDSAYEGNETVTYELSSPTNGFLGAQTRHRVTIVDDDPQPPPADPGPTPASALFIDLQTLPRQSYLQNLRPNDRDVFRVHLNAGENLAIDVDPAKVGLAQGLMSSTLVVIAPDRVTTLTTVGRSAEPDTGVITDNPAYLFHATQTGDYYLRLQTSQTGLSGYRIFFHRLGGVSEHVPAPELLNVPGSMYASFDGQHTVAVTGPTGYGFTLDGPWQQQVALVRRTGLSSQTLTLAAGSQFTMHSPQGVDLPLVTNGPIVISTIAQRWGNIVGAVSTSAIDFPVSLGIAPINDLLADVFGSQIVAVGLLSGDWRISLGGKVLAVKGKNGLQNTTSEITPLLEGVPYLREKGPIKVNAQLGSYSLNYTVIDKPIDWAFDPGDPMLYLKVDEAGQVKQPALALSLHGLLEYKPQDAPSPLVDAGVTQFFGHVYATATIPFKVGPIPMKVEADEVINIDADRDGRVLGDLRDVDELFDILQGDFSEVREVLHDVQFGANGKLTAVLKENKFEVELGRASMVLNGPEETIWVRGQQGGGANPLAGTPLEDFNTGTTIVFEGLVSLSGNFLLSTTTTYDVGPADFTYNITITQDGIFAHVEGNAKFSADIDYGGGTVGGTAKATFTADIAIDVDDDGEIHLSGSVSASGKLSAKIAGQNTTLFSGSISASVRSRGFQFRFPRGVGEINLNLF